MRETFRDPVPTGAQGRPRLRPGRNLCSAQVVKRDAQRCVVEVERRIVDGTPARVETLRRRSHGDGVINTASIERLNTTFRERTDQVASGQPQVFFPQPPGPKRLAGGAAASRLLGQRPAIDDQFAPGDIRRVV